MRPWYRIIESGIRRCFSEPLRFSIRVLPRSEHDAIRYSMYKRISQVLAERPDGEVLSISGSTYLAGLIGSGKCRIREADFPEHNILDLKFDDDKFDYVVSDQVLEHIEGNPFQAMHESYRVLKPGGVAVHTTCLLVGIHRYPGDYWRFTPDGLRILSREFSEILDVGGWGNRYLWAMSWLGLLHSERVPNSSWHPYHRIAIHNEEDYPISTWIIARK